MTPVPTPIPTPLPTEKDARNRAVRTFVQGLLIDVAVGLILTIGPLLLGSGFSFSRDYWAAIGLLTAKTVIQTCVSYAARKIVPPPQARRD